MDKPLCGKCETRHWRFVACADAPVVNAREESNAVKKEASKVYPEWRNGEGRLAPVSVNWTTDYKRGR